MAGEARPVRQLTSGDGEVSSIKAIDPANRVVYYISNEGDPREQQLWTVKLDGTERQQLTKAHGVHKPEFSPNGREYADNFSDIQDAADRRDVQRNGNRLPCCSGIRS